MPSAKSLKLREIAERSGATLDADDESNDVVIASAAGLEEAGPAELAFVRSTTHRDHVLRSKAGVFAVNPDFDRGEIEAPLLRHPNPRYVFAVALAMLAPERKVSPGIHATACVARSAKIDPTAEIGPFAVIEANVVIGPESVVGAHVVVGRDSVIGRACRLDARVTLYPECRLKDRVRVLSGAVLGADGFGFEPYEGVIHRLEHLGHVEIGDDAEIGANTCVDRATTGVTRIGAQSKLDNLVMVGHNCKLGAATMVAGQSGIAGSSSTGQGVILGGGTRVRDQVKIGDGAVVGGASGVTNDLPPGARVSGLPAREHRDTLKELLALKRLPELLHKVRRLERRIEELESDSKSNSSSNSDSDRSS